MKILTKEAFMGFEVGNTTFGFTMRVPKSYEASGHELISSHAQ